MLDKAEFNKYISRLREALYLNAEKLIFGKKITNKEYIKVQGMRELVADISQRIDSGEFDLKEKKYAG